MNDSANAFRAGLVILAGFIVALAFFFSSKKTSLDESTAIPYYALLTDASGCNAKSLITVAGLQVGEIRNITLVDVPVAELIPDFEPRAKLILDPQATGLQNIDKNEDFDLLLRRLIERAKATTWPEVEPLGQERVRVARVDMMITRDVQVPKDSWVRKESLGLLGAKALFLDLGRSEELLTTGGRVVNVRSMTGTDALLAQAEGIVSDVRSITKKIDHDIAGITGDIKGITGELNRFINGDEDTKPLGEIYTLVMTDLRKLSNTVEIAVRDASKLMRDNDEQFAKLVTNVQRITADIADMTSGSPGVDGGPEGEGDIRATMASVRKVADDLSVVTSQLKTVLGDNEAEVGESVKKLSNTLTELNRSLTSLSEVAGRVERGEGTVGRLLTDEKMADKVEAAVSGASDFVSSLTSLETHIDVGSWYNFNRAQTTTTVSLKLQPKPDKFYLIEVVDDGGRLERSTIIEADGTERRASIREEDNQIRFTAMYAKRFFDFLVLRAGLIETSGGVGANLFFWDNRIELRSDLFNFRGPRDSLIVDDYPGTYLPRWRSVLKIQPIPHLYLSAGVDDVLNSVGPNGFQVYTNDLGFGLDYFVGVGLTFKDDDLRSILPFIPGG